MLAPMWLLVSAKPRVTCVNMGAPELAEARAAQRYLIMMDRRGKLSAGIATCLAQKPRANAQIESLTSIWDVSGEQKIAWSSRLAVAREQAVAAFMKCRLADAAVAIQQSQHTTPREPAFHTCTIKG